MWDIPAAFPFPGRGETRPWAIPVGQHSWKGQLDGLETCKITNFPNSVQLSSLAQTGWCCQSCWAYPLLRLLLHKICPALLANGIFFGCLPWAELQSTDSALSQNGAATTHFFLPYLLKQICDVSTTEVWTWTRVNYVYLEQLISFCHVPPQWDHHLREESWSISTAFPVDLGDMGSVFCCDRLSLWASVT